MNEIIEIITYFAKSDNSQSDYTKLLQDYIIVNDMKSNNIKRLFKLNCINYNIIKDFHSS